MRTVIVIPARGGSKGIPRKNLRPFGGAPPATGAWWIFICSPTRTFFEMNTALSELIAMEEHGRLWEQHVLNYPVWPLLRLERY